MTEVNVEPSTLCSALKCRQCQSLKLILTVRLFINETKHLEVRCKSCGSRYYESKSYMTDGISVEPSARSHKALQLTLL